MIVIISLSIVSESLAGAEVPAGEIYYSGLLVPTADPVQSLTIKGYLATFPVGAVGQVSFPITRYLTGSVYGGISGYPAGFLGSVYLKAHILQPDSRHWGLAAQAQWGVATVFSGGEGSGGMVSALELAVSSPVKPTRVHFGAVLHTMPGSEYKAGWENAKDYDFKNPQPTVFASFGHTFKNVTIFAEAFWVAMGADEGWDSVFATVLGGSFPVGRGKLKIASGVLIERFRSSNPRTLPVPPIVALAIPI